MDWGFNQFLPLVDLADPARGFVHEGGKLRIRVEVLVRKDERLSWDSRKETGYVGLKNQGATCYMNSLLQCLYHLPYFRKVGDGEGGVRRGTRRAGAGARAGGGWQWSCTMCAQMNVELRCSCAAAQPASPCQ
jgi:hypothetical protein